MDDVQRALKPLWHAKPETADKVRQGLCGWNGLALPEWCVAPVGEALDLYNQRSKRGRGRGQSPKDAFANAQMHKQRHGMVVFERMFPNPDGRFPGLDEACERVSESQQSAERDRAHDQGELQQDRTYAQIGFLIVGTARHPVL